MSSEGSKKPRRPRPRPAEAGRPKGAEAGRPRGGEAGRPRGSRSPARPRVVRDGEVVVIVPTRRAADGSKVLCLPKGHLDPGETPQQAATREVREETGLSAELVKDLGEVRYWYRRDGRSVPKSVAFFLFRYLSGDTADHDDEVEEARWMDLREAPEALSYEGEREVARRALAALDEHGGPAGPGRSPRDAQDR
jgi:8-oxo-dGTP pyrophosphatase MutT (NUDIX family)